MKTLSSILLYATFFFVAAQTASANNSSPKKSVKCQKLQPSGNYVIDLIALGALNKDTVNDLSSAPNLIELMRDSYSASFGFEMEDTMKNDTVTSEPFEASVISTENESEQNNQQPFIVQQKLRFSAILCVILFVFIVVAGFTSPLFRKAYGFAISELTPFSLSRCILFIWIFFLLGTSFTIFGSTGNFPHYVISIPYFGGVVFITYLFTFFVEKIGYRNDKNGIFKRKSTGVFNDLLRFKGKICLPRLQYLLVSMVHLGFLIVPAWQHLFFIDLPGFLFVLQTLSSAIYVGHKAACLQNFHALIFRKSMRT